jgi:hypothetical protein
MHNLQVSPSAIVTGSGLISSSSRARHKKCNEEKPRCSQCVVAGWKCDFVSDASARVLEMGITPLSSAPLHLSATPLLDSERRHMEYFQSVCARDVALFFELPIWETIMLQGVQAEPTLHHAALAIGALSRSRYYPDGGRNHPTLVFAIRKYTKATHSLRSLLAEPAPDFELVILASIALGYTEFLLDCDSQIEMHVQAGRDITMVLCEGRHSTSDTALQGGLESRESGTPSRLDILQEGMLQLGAQFSDSSSVSHARSENPIMK